MESTLWIGCLGEANQTYLRTYIHQFINVCVRPGGEGRSINQEIKGPFKEATEGDNYNTGM